MASKGAKRALPGVGAVIDEKFNWASNVKLAWMFVLGALVTGIVVGATLL